MTKVVLAACAVMIGLLVALSACNSPLELDADRVTDSSDVVVEEPPATDTNTDTRIKIKDVVFGPFEQLAFENGGPITFPEEWHPSTHANSISINLDSSHTWTVLSFEFDLDLTSAMPIAGLPVDIHRVTGIHVKLDSVLVTERQRSHILDSQNYDDHVLELRVTRFRRWDGARVGNEIQLGQAEIALFKKTLSDGSGEIHGHIFLNSESNFGGGPNLRFFQLLGSFFIEY